MQISQNPPINTYPQNHFVNPPHLQNNIPQPNNVHPQYNQNFNNGYQNNQKFTNINNFSNLGQTFPPNMTNTSQNSFPTHNQNLQHIQPRMPLQPLRHQNIQNISRQNIPMNMPPHQFNPNAFPPQNMHPQMYPPKNINQARNTGNLGPTNFANPSGNQIKPSGLYTPNPQKIEMMDNQKKTRI